MQVYRCARLLSHTVAGIFICVCQVCVHASLQRPVRLSSSCQRGFSADNGKCKSSRGNPRNRSLGKLAERRPPLDAPSTLVVVTKPRQESGEWFESDKGTGKQSSRAFMFSFFLFLDILPIFIRTNWCLKPSRMAKKRKDRLSLPDHPSWSAAAV
jgi:hypothetical protein